MSEKEKSDLEQQNTEITIVNEQSIRDKIYVVRGMQIMLDFELAEIYGYTTSAFNQQIKRNEGKFPEDFRFQLTTEEYKSLLSQNVTASWGGDRRSEPWAFTESGIYMLMTVLKGDIATKQSIALIRTFRAMKDYIVRNQNLIDQHNYLRLSMQITETRKELSEANRNMQNIESLVMEHDQKLIGVMEQLSDTVRKSELSPIMQDFSEEVQREYLFLDGQPMKADAAYIGIYAQAKQTIHIVDDYLGAKTLHLLQDVQNGVSITIFSDNKAGKLSASDYQDFRTQFPGIQIVFIRTENKTHDRFIVLDYDSDEERIFHCGASSKDAGKKLAAITEFAEGAVKQSLHGVIADMLGNAMLILA